MITDAISSFIEHLWSNHAWILHLAFVSLIWWFWHVWSFTIRPQLYPDEPDYLPYWIPFVGHALPMFRNQIGLYRRARKYYGGSKKAFTLRVMGQDIVIVTDPSEQSQVYKDIVSYSFDGFMDLAYRTVGNVSESAIRNLWRSPRDGFESLHPNPKELVLAHTGYTLLHKQLIQPDRLQNLIDNVVTRIDEATNASTENFYSSILASDHTDRIVSLHQWCLDVLIEAQTRAFFGKSLHEILPQYTSYFDQWDINSWMVMYQYPSFLAQAAIKPRDALIQAFTKYLALPKEERLGGEPFVDELYEENAHGGLDTEDCARILFIILWGINGNVQMTAFWTMAHIVSRPELATAIRQEISPVMTAIEETSQPANMTKIIREQFMERTPLLNAVFAEILRYCSTGASVREVKRPVTLANKVLKPGTRVMLPQRQSLMATEAYGEDAAHFKPERFLHSKNFDRNEFYRPFGGGTTLCSGQTVGRYEVLVFVAFALWRYDFKVVPKGEVEMGVQGCGFPRIDEAKPGVGVSKQVEGDDLILRLTRRKCTSMPKM